MEPTFLRLLILVISVSLLGSGVSWFHAYSLLWVPIVLGLPFVMRAEHKRGSLDLQLFLIVSGFFGLLYHVLPTGLQEGLAIYSVYVLCQLPLLVFIWLRAMRFSDLAEAQYGI